MIPIYSIQLKSFLDRMRKSDAIFVRGSPILLSFQFSYDSILLMYDVWHPPLESWLLSKTVLIGIFGQLNRITVFDVLERYPLG